MRIAVTGGTGKLGRHVVRRLTDVGHTSSTSTARGSGPAGSCAST